MEKITCYGCSPQTREIEKFIKNTFYKPEHPMASISTENVEIIADALFKKYQRNYSIEVIDTAGLLVEDGCIITTQLEPLDDWDGKEGTFEKKWLYLHLDNIIDVLGKPTSVIEAGGKYYARWTRNIITWF